MAENEEIHIHKYKKTDEGFKCEGCGSLLPIYQHEYLENVLNEGNYYEVNIGSVIAMAIYDQKDLVKDNETLLKNRESLSTRCDELGKEILLLKTENTSLRDTVKEAKKILNDFNARLAEYRMIDSLIEAIYKSRKSTEYESKISRVLELLPVDMEEDPQEKIRKLLGGILNE